MPLNDSEVGGSRLLLHFGGLVNSVGTQTLARLCLN